MSKTIKTCGNYMVYRDGARVAGFALEGAYPGKLLCTGEIERRLGFIIHEGSDCPIHESLEGFRTEIKDESDIPVRYIRLDMLYAETKGTVTDE